MKFKKLFAVILSAVFIFSLGGTAFALDQMSIPNEIIDEQETNTSKPCEELGICYKAFTGVVKEIKDRENNEGCKMIFVENEEGAPAYVIISHDTYILENAEIKIGDTISAYYDTRKPMIMIYPPQYAAEVVVIESPDRSVKFDIFDENLTSSDNQLKLNISDETEIVFYDGTPYEGELVWKRLVVIYIISTKSIPAQTTPEKVIVLPDKIEDMVEYDVSSAEIIVEDKKIEAPPAYEKEGTVMVPLRAIAEALGYEVLWHNETQSVSLGQDIQLTIGKNEYIADKDIIKLERAPELCNKKTFVPLSFFRKVVKMNNAYLFEGQIVIDNNEVME